MEKLSSVEDSNDTSGVSNSCIRGVPSITVVLLLGEELLDNSTPSWSLFRSASTGKLNGISQELSKNGSSQELGNVVLPG